VVRFRYEYQRGDIGHHFQWEVFAQPVDCADPMPGNNVNLRRVMVRP
jgi:hypothetical protein